MSSNVFKNAYATLINAEIVVPEISYYEHKITRYAYYFTMHPMFNTVIMLIIVMNTVMLAFDRYPEPPDDQQEIFYIFNIVFTVIFGIEVLIKILAFSIRGFVRDKFNIFDAIVVLSSVVELTLDDGSGSSLGALRAVRLFRIFKIFRVGDLRVLMDSIGMTVMGMGNYTVLLLLFIYLYALLGMQFFAGKFTFGYDGLYDSDGEVPRENFDTIWEAFITIIIIMIGDGWNNIMYYGMLSLGDGYSIYFVTLYTFGNIIMLNLFLAILLGNFDNSRQLMAKHKAFNEFKRLNKKGIPLRSALVSVLGDLGEYIDQNVLKDDDSSFEEEEIKSEMKSSSKVRSQPLPNKPPETADDKHISEVGEEAKFQVTNMFEDEKLPRESSKNNQDEVYPQHSKGQEDFLYDSFAKSHESVEKMMRIDNEGIQNRREYDSLSNSIMENKKTVALPPITIMTSYTKEFPANQQEGAAYDEGLKEDRDLSHREPFNDDHLSKIQDEEEASKSDMELSSNKMIKFGSTKKKIKEPKHLKSNKSKSSQSVAPEFEDSDDEIDV